MNERGDPTPCSVAVVRQVRSTRAGGLEMLHGLQHAMTERRCEACPHFPRVHQAAVLVDANQQRLERAEGRDHNCGAAGGPLRHPRGSRLGRIGSESSCWALERAGGIPAARSAEGRPSSVRRFKLPLRRTSAQPIRASTCRYPGSSSHDLREPGPIEDGKTHVAVAQADRVAARIRPGPATCRRYARTRRTPEWKNLGLAKANFAAPREEVGSGEIKRIAEFNQHVQ